MKFNKAIGWKNVYNFTLVQMLKSKTYQITTIVMILLILIGLPITQYIMNTKDSTVDLTKIDKIYVINQSSIENIPDSLNQSNLTSHPVPLVITNDTVDVVVNNINEHEPDSLLFLMTEVDESITISSYSKLESISTSPELRDMKKSFAMQMKNDELESHGLTEKQTELIESTSQVTIEKIDQTGTVIDNQVSKISNAEYYVVYGILFVILMISTLSSSMVSTAIVTEKSTRVIEYLIINVRPFALMLGKIFATITCVLLQILAVIVAAFISNKLTSLTIKDTTSLFATYIPSDILANITISKIIIILLVLILGIIVFSTISGICGATVSRIEELNEGLLLYTIALLISCYTALAAVNVMLFNSNNPFVIFALLCPLTSPFILPGAIIVGSTTWIIILCSIVLQFLFVYFILNVTSKIYATLILHSGNRIKVKELIQMFRVTK